LIDRGCRLTRGARLRYPGWSGAAGRSRKLRTCRATRRRPVFGRLLAVQFKRSAKEGDVRVTTAFNRMLGLRGAWVRDVAFGAEGVIVTVALRRKQPVCSGCGARGLKIKDHRSSAGGIWMWAACGA
jgi:hypothetical protein